MNTDGSEQINLTNTQGIDIWPVFSPDGSKIAFNSYRDDNSERALNYEIYIMNTDGSEQINLTNKSGDDWWPVFQPESTSP